MFLAQKFKYRKAAMKIIPWGWSRITEKNSLQITLYHTVLEMLTIVIIINIIIVVVIIVVLIVDGKNNVVDQDIR